MSYTYKCIEQKLFSESIGNYITYGIEITEGNKIINDVSCNREKACKIIELLNQYQVSPIHLNEVIENLISA